MTRYLYTFLLALACPLVLARLWRRGRREPGYRRHIGERFGAYSQAPLENCLWIHAVSVGEVRAAAPLFAELRARYPKRSLLITCMTVTGRATAEELFGGQATICYLPYDFSWALQRLLARFQPAILLVMETEIWFNLIHVCAAAQVPALLVNARLSGRSRARYRRWALVRRLAQQTLPKFAHVATQSTADAERFATLGEARITVTGNMKFDVSIDDERVSLGRSWRQLLTSDRRVLLAASTRDGEEKLLLAAYLNAFDVAARQQTLLVIVPRHPARFDDVAAEISAHGLSCARRSVQLDGPGVTAEVWLGDSMGEMFAYYALCDVAFVGGSLVPAGGHNLIEACALGKPVLMGPSTFNFTDVSAAAVEAGALRVVESADAMMAEARSMLTNLAERMRMGENALTFATAHKGATQKTLALIAPLVR